MDQQRKEEAAAPPALANHCEASQKTVDADPSKAASEPTSNNTVASDGKDEAVQPPESACSTVEQVDSEPPNGDDDDDEANIADKNTNTKETATDSSNNSPSNNNKRKDPPTTTATTNGNTKESPKKEATIDTTKPVKRARSAYFIFTDAKRAEVTAQHPNQGVAVLARHLGQLWSAMSDVDKRPYQEQAAAERERVQREVAAWKAAGGSVHGLDKNNNKSNDLSHLEFPVARVKKIAKLDPDVKNINREATYLLCKTTELFLQQFGKECVSTASILNRRTLWPDDLVSVCHTRECFSFLSVDLQDFRKALPTKQPKLSKKQPPVETTGSKPITEYFASK